MIEIGASPHAALAASGVEFGVDLVRLVPIPLPDEVVALMSKDFVWPVAAKP